MENKSNIILALQGVILLWLLLLSYKVFFAAGVSSDVLMNAQQRAMANTSPIMPNSPNTPNTPAPAPKDPSTFTTMSFKDEVFDFGTIKEGEKASKVFTFKNTGDKPLIIENAQGSCGCTVPKFPKEPIAPGATGEINVEFNSEGKKGQQEKYVTIKANMAEDVRLTVKGTVEGSPTAAGGPTAGGASASTVIKTDQ